MENKEVDLETFLENERKKGMVRFAKWMVVVVLVTVGVIGGMFWLFDSAVQLFMR